MKNPEIKANKNAVYKEELTDSIAKISGLSRPQASRALKSILESIQKGLKENKKVRITGFGTFKIAQRPATQGVHIRTGKKFTIPATKYPFFRSGKILRGWEAV
ncbi:MAG: HU family DNA-binding protein [Alphaproteobacteria bacterium]|nr:HU family DNA-binding protein [Alphaproteobacteria bacterium]